MNDEALKNISNFIREAMDVWEVPGASVCIVENGQTLISTAFGVKDIKTEEPATTDTVFWIASNTKAIASFSVALLVEDGKIGWDEPLRSYLPSLRMANNELTENVAISDLLCHRTGIPGTYDWFLRDPNISRQDLFDQLRYLKPNRPFRTSFQYNNLMYAFAGYVVETISGMAWESFVEKRMFAPLGINTFDFNYMLPDKHPDLSRSYAHTPDGIVEIPELTPWATRFWTSAPAGGVNTNIAEVEKWLRLHLNGGVVSGTPLIGKGNIETMYAPRMPVANTGPCPELSFSTAALGWQVSYHRGNRKISHGGALGSYIAFLPEKNIGVAMLTNMATPLAQAAAARTFDEALGLDPAPWIDRYSAQLEGERNGMLKAIENATIPAVPNTKCSFSPKELAGTYKYDIGGELTISICDEKLVVDGFEAPAELEHLHFDTFATRIPQLPMPVYATFYRDVHGTCSQIKLRVPSGLEVTYKKR